ncbi:MAG: virulence RhuM family protein [Acidaminococcaceae bacterium]|nr:virulence RhuM family protein [Acidaminococcaceae bacterium]
MENNQFILYTTEDGKAAIKLYADNNTIWLNQAQMAELFATSKQNISLHIKNILEEGELNADAVVKEYLTTANDGKTYNVAYYSLDVILAVGFRVRSARGTQFRKWANTTLKEYLQKGFVLDKERLKNPDGRPDYFDELLAEIRDIRASEKRFYQKLRDLFALSSDYISNDTDIQMFFAQTQNKLIYGVTGMTAAELVFNRADGAKPNMALTNWEGRVVRKKDIYTAKNYLTKDEIEVLNQLVSVFLENAELRVKLRKDLTIGYWQTVVDKLLLDNDIKLLQGNGNISHADMEQFVDAEYEKFDNRRKRSDALTADKQDLEELEEEIKKIK